MTVTQNGPLDTQDTAAAVVTPSDVVEYGRRWAPYGGPSAFDIMVEFGWTPNRFFTELRGILADGPPDGLSAPMVTQMLTVCRQRIWMGR